MAKQKYYTLTNILNKQAQYNIILGERSNGKSYAVKHYCIKQAWDDDNAKFIYLRRQAEEIRQSIAEAYFSDVDISTISNGKCDCITVYRGEIYACKMDEVTLKPNKIKLLGYVRALVKASQYKSGSYLDVKNIIYEEFIIESSARYLHDEPNLLMSFVSTVARRNNISIWMVGNTISRICPYFTEWELNNIPHQKQGTIDIYEQHTDQLDEDGNEIVVKIAVENAENSGNNSKMFFGAKSKMITGGVWQTEAQPHLPKPLEDYQILYTCVVIGGGFKFLLRFLSDGSNFFWYVEPKTTEIKPNTRIISNEFNPSPYHTRGFIGVTPAETQIFKYIAQRKICYASNLCGADFKAVLLNFAI